MIAEHEARRLAQNERSKRRRSRAYDAVESAEDGRAPIPEHLHGTEGGATNRKCPCEECRDAASRARAERRRRSG